MQWSCLRQFLSVRVVTFLMLFAISIPLVRAQEKFDTASDELFVFRPNTPERRIRGAVLAEQLDRPGLAQGYLAELMDSQPTTETLQQLRRAFGIGTFLKLAATRELQPQSRELLQMINEASREEATASNAVESLISELGQSKQQTVAASLKILAAEGDAVAPLLSADRNTPHGELAARLLEKYARRFRDALITELPEADSGTQVRILRLLAGTSASEIVPDLTRYRFSESAEVAAAATAAIRVLAGAEAAVDTKQDTIDALHHEAVFLIRRAGDRYSTIDDHAEDRRLQEIPADQPVVYGAGFLQRAVELTGIAEQISADSAEVLAMKIVAELTEQSWPATWPADVTLPNRSEPPVDVSEVDALALQMAVQTGNTASILSVLRRGAVAAQVLAGNPAVTRELLMHSSSRVRLLTAGLLHVSGESHYRVRDILAAAVSGSGKSEAVVIDTRKSEAPTVAAVINDVGYATTASRTGQGGFELATSQMQCELILVHSNCLRWSLSQTMANLRADYRTRQVPIIVYGPSNHRSRTELARSGYQGVWFLSEPISDELSNIDQFLGASGRVTDPTIVAERFRLEGIPQAVLSKDERLQMIQFARNLE